MLDRIARLLLSYQNVLEFHSTPRARSRPDQKPRSVRLEKEAALAGVLADALNKSTTPEANDTALRQFLIMFPDEAAPINPVVERIGEETSHDPPIIPVAPSKTPAPKDISIVHNSSARPVGLESLGKASYVNAVLQAVFAVIDFKEILTIAGRQHLNRPPESKIDFDKSVKLLRKDYDKWEFNPFWELNEMSNYYRSTTQEGGNEFYSRRRNLRKSFGVISKEFEDWGANKMRPPHLFWSMIIRCIIVGHSVGQYHEKINSRLNLLYGFRNFMIDECIALNGNEKACQNRWGTYFADDFIAVDFDLPEDIYLDTKRSISLKELWRHNNQSFPSDNECTYCGTPGFRQTWLGISSSPKILAIHFPRGIMPEVEDTIEGMSARTKLQYSIDLSETFRIDSFHFEDNTKIRSTATYHLRAVIKHRGPHLDGGHCVTYINENLGSLAWWFCDDETIENASWEGVISNSDVHGGQIWMAIYEIEKAPQAPGQ